MQNSGCNSRMNPRGHSGEARAFVVSFMPAPGYARRRQFQPEIDIVRDLGQEPARLENEFDEEKLEVAHLGLYMSDCDRPSASGFASRGSA